MNLGIPGAIHSLAEKAVARTQKAFQPSTQAAYNRHFRSFLAYTIVMNVDVICSPVSIMLLLSFLEFLVQNNTSHSGIANCLSAIKAKLALHGKSVQAFNDPRITYYQKALIMDKPFKVKINAIIDIPLLSRIISFCDTLYMGQVYKTAYLIAFFSFLRISNLVPHKISSYSPLKQLARADIIFGPPGLHLVLKWSKTMQAKNAVRIIKLPQLPLSPLCPVNATRKMLKLAPGTADSPLFQIKSKSQWLPLTDYQLRKHLKGIMLKLNMSQAGITFHSFRRSGATFAFNANVPMQNIKSHGTWTSNAVWRYITQDHNTSEQVARAFQTALSCTTS